MELNLLLVLKSSPTTKTSLSDTDGILCLNADHSQVSVEYTLSLPHSQSRTVSPLGQGRQGFRFKCPSLFSATPSQPTAASDADTPAAPTTHNSFAHLLFSGMFSSDVRVDGFIGF